MKKLKEILEFIMALLGFLLNLKKRKPDEVGKKTIVPERLPVVVRPAVAGPVSGLVGDDGLVGGPFRGSVGLCRSPVDTLGVRQTGYISRKRKASNLPALVGWGMLAYAVGSCLLKMA